MNYLILAETEFFALINGAGNGNNMEAAYNGFVESVISLRLSLPAASLH